MSLSKAPFKSYSSIDNHYNAKFIQALRETGDEKEKWVAMEKIHGANFSITLFSSETNSKVDVLYARRGAYLGQEKFYGSDHIKARYEERFISLFKYLENLLKLKPGTVVRVYGEHCGGLYPGISRSKVKPVQKGIYYSPDYEFIPFDILIDNVYQDCDNVCQWLEHCAIPCCPILIVGTLDDLLKLNPVFESTIYKLYGLPRVDDNMAEGFVFKPMRNRHLSRGDRAIIKLKNPKFAEIAMGKLPDEKEPAPLSSAAEELLVKAAGYVNENRYNNLMSKLSEEDKQIEPKIIGMLSSDALKDFIKDLTDETVIEEVGKARLKVAIKEASRLLVSKIIEKEKSVSS